MSLSFSTPRPPRLPVGTLGYFGLNLNSRSCQCLSNRRSNAWIDGASATSLGREFQCFGVRHLKECFLSSVLARCWKTLYLWPLRFDTMGVMLIVVDLS